MEEREVKVEGSIPVQSRIDIRSLANMEKWFLKEGMHIRTMSQLVSWTVDYMVELLSLNDKLDETVGSIEEAYQYLRLRGLMQRSMEKKGAKKLLRARGYESLRSQGADPAYEDPSGFKQIHNQPRSKVSPFQTVGVKESNSYMDDIDKAFDKIKEEDMEATKKKGREAVEWEVDEKTGLTVCKVQSSDIGQVDQDDLDKWEKEKLEEQKKLYEESKVGSDEPRKMSEEELDKKGEEIRKKDEERAKLERDMVNPDR